MGLFKQKAMKIELQICKRTMSDNHSFYYISVNGEAKSDTICYTLEEAERYYNHYKVCIAVNEKGKTETIKSEKL